jgi:aryl-alcohol dehydrogenase-like predicted oxidoreductase
MRDELSLIYREEERGMLPLCLADGIGIIPKSPLGGGKLTRPWGTRTDRARTDLSTSSQRSSRSTRP